MSVLGKVTVETAKVVKVVSMVGIAASAAVMMAVGLGVLLSGGALTPELGVKAFLGFVAAQAGWYAGDFVQGRLERTAIRERQEAEMMRLQGTSSLAR